MQNITENVPAPVNRYTTPKRKRNCCRVCEVYQCTEDHAQWPCIECGEWKDREEFYIVRRKKKPNKPLRRVSRCRSCEAVRRQERAKTPDHELQRAYTIASRYSITIEQYDAMVVAQDGLCLICGRPPRGCSRLAIDHDHLCCPSGRSCGECIRGLICRSCNSALAMMGDVPERLESAATYLRERAYVPV